MSFHPPSSAAPFSASRRTSPAVGVTVRGARLAFEGQPLFDALDADFPGGATTCLLGPSGVGKTSLLRVIAGLEPGGEAARGSDGQSLGGRFFVAEEGVPAYDELILIANAERTDDPRLARFLDAIEAGGRFLVNRTQPARMGRQAAPLRTQAGGAPPRTLRSRCRLPPRTRAHRRGARPRQLCRRSKPLTRSAGARRSRYRRPEAPWVPCRCGHAQFVPEATARSRTGARF